MKILFYYPGDLNLNRGTPNRARNIIRFISKKEEVIVAVAKLNPDSLSSKVRFFRLKERSRFSGINFFRKVRELKKIIESVQPDIVYGFSNNSNLVLGTLTELLKIPTVVEIHDPDFKERTIFNDLIFFLGKIALKNMAGIVTVSGKLKSYYLKLLENPRLNIKVIRGGVDTSLFNPNVVPSEELTNIKKKGNILVGYIGNFRYYQGLDFLIKAAYKLKEKNFHFVLLGGETVQDREKMKKKIKNNSLQENVSVLGEKKYEQIPPYLKAIDILVIPRPSLSITEFAFPSKLSEYMAMRKPVIATEVGGAREIIKNKENGILIPPENIPDNLTKTLLFLKETPLLREKIRRNAYKYVKNNLSWDKLTDELILFLQKIISKHEKQL